MEKQCHLQWYGRCLYSFVVWRIWVFKYTIFIYFRHSLWNEMTLLWPFYKCVSRHVIVMARVIVTEQKNNITYCDIYGLTVDGVWFGNCIYWTLTGRNYNSAIRNSHALQQLVRTLLSLLGFHQSLPREWSQQCPQLPCSRCYRLATVPQLTHCSNCSAYNISARTTLKIPFLCCCSIVA
jgi:hypothetical protein